MKQRLLSLLVLCIGVACSNEGANTYEERIIKCIEQRDLNQIEHPNIIILSSRNCILGSKIPELNSQSLSGVKIDKNYFAGKAGIINFWFEGCPPCVAEIPFLNKIVDLYDHEELFFLAIGRDSKEDILYFLEEHPWKFDQVDNGKVLIDSIFKLPWGYPTSFIVNKEGIITHTLGGISENNELELLNIFRDITN